MKKQLIMTALASILLGGASTAATLHVARDGSGDFAVIQDAIDAASPGDTIWIHAGRYDEMTEDWDVWGNNTVIADVHLAITKDNLTLRGDGADQTIIGPEVYPDSPPSNYIGISVTSTHANSLTVQDLTVEHTRYGMYVACDELDVLGCRFNANRVEGVRLFTAERSSIEDCVFLETYRGIVSYSPTSNLSISGCSFELLENNYAAIGCVCVNTSNVTINDCQFTGGAGAIDLQQGSNGIISNVVATEYLVYGLKLPMGGSAELYDSRFEGGLRAVISDGNSLLCERSSFINQTYRTIQINSSGISSFNDCEIINGGGWSVYCDYNGSGDCHVDMTDCYWGTDSAEQIAEWIWDGDDDPERCCIVDFEPFVGPVAIEPHSWSAVKGLFQGEPRD